MNTLRLILAASGLALLIAAPVLIVLLGRTGIALFTYPVLLVIAIVTGVAWEIVEAREDAEDIVRG